MHIGTEPNSLLSQRLATSDAVDVAIGILTYRMETSPPEAERVLLDWARLTKIDLVVLSELIADAALSRDPDDAAPRTHNTGPRSDQNPAVPTRVGSRSAGTDVLDGVWLDHLGEALVMASTPANRALVLVTVVHEICEITRQLEAQDADPPRNGPTGLAPRELENLKAILTDARQHLTEMNQSDRS